MSFDFVRSVAIRFTGVCAALAISGLAASARGEVLSQHMMAGGAASQPSSVVAVLNSQSASPAPLPSHASAAAHAVLSAPGAHGYAAAPRKPVFAESILVNPGFTMTLSLAKPSGQTHLTGVVRPQLLQ